jgi:hypothetical protein
LCGVVFADRRGKIGVTVVERDEAGEGRDWRSAGLVESDNSARLRSDHKGERSSEHGVVGDAWNTPEETARLVTDGSERVGDDAEVVGGVERHGMGLLL